MTIYLSKHGRRIIFWARNDPPRRELSSPGVPRPVMTSGSDIQSYWPAASHGTSGHWYKHAPWAPGLMVRTCGQHWQGSVYREYMLCNCRTLPQQTLALCWGERGIKSCLSTSRGREQFQLMGSMPACDPPPYLLVPINNPSAISRVFGTLKPFCFHWMEFWFLRAWLGENREANDGWIAHPIQDSRLSD